MRKDMLELREQNKLLNAQLQQLKEASVQVRAAPPARFTQLTNSGKSDPANPQQTAEIKRLQLQYDSTNTQLQSAKAALDKLKREHSKQSEELAIALKDRTRFKDLSEGYMKEVAKLEA